MNRAGVIAAIVIGAGLVALAIGGKKKAAPRPPAPRGGGRLAPPPQALADTIAANAGANIPVEYLWSVAFHESRYTPRIVNASGFVGLFQIHPRWLGAAVSPDPGTYNAAHPDAPLTAEDLKDPAKATRVAVWMLEEIIATYALNHIDALFPDWDSPRWVELLALGYGQGFSERAGVGRVVTMLEAEGVPWNEITVDAVAAAAARAGAVATLAEEKRVAHAKRTATGYFVLRGSRTAPPDAGEPRS